MQSGFDMNRLARDAQIRWLKPVEVLSILQNYEEHQLSHQIPQKPAGGSLYLFNKQVLKFFRKDGHSWRRRKDQRTISEAHEKLKVGNAEALNCYYAHGAENPYFQRRSYWMLDPRHEHIVLVHYRNVHEGRQNAGSTSQFSALTSTLSHSHNPFATCQLDSSFFISESSGLFASSPTYVKNHEFSQLDIKESTDEVSCSPLLELSQALRRIEHQLSLNDEEEKEPETFHIENENSNDLEDVLYDHELSDGVWLHHQLLGVEDAIWKNMHNSNNMPSVESGLQYEGQDDSSLIFQEVDSLKYHQYSPVSHNYGTTSDLCASIFDQRSSESSLENNLSLTIAQKQKFTIREISPDWCFSSDGAKIIIIGSFLSDPLECAWTCMIGESEVPVEIIQEGVLCCHAPPHLPGKVNICITSGNRESCSEVREFEYRAKPSSCKHNNPPETDAYKSSEEQLLLVRFVHMLLSHWMPEKDSSQFITDLLGKSRLSEDLRNCWDLSLIGEGSRKF